MSFYCLGVQTVCSLRRCKLHIIRSAAQAAELIHFAATPFPKKSFDFSGTPKFAKTSASYSLLQ